MIWDQRWVETMFPHNTGCGSHCWNFHQNCSLFVLLSKTGMLDKKMKDYEVRCTELQSKWQSYKLSEQHSNRPSLFLLSNNQHPALCVHFTGTVVLETCNLLSLFQSCHVCQVALSGVIQRIHFLRKKTFLYFASRWYLLMVIYSWLVSIPSEQFLHIYSIWMNHPDIYIFFHEFLLVVTSTSSFL